jgi:hypothetical protein
MTTVRKPHASSSSETETNGNVIESGDAEITDRSKENDYNTVEKVKRNCENSEMKFDALTNKSPDIINGLNLSKIFLADDNLTEDPGYCIDERLKKNAIECQNVIEKWRIIRDVLMISLAFMVHFTAFIGTSHLQSSVNAAEGLGTRALMTIYVGLSVSAIFVPVLLIKYVNHIAETLNSIIN